jgi:hypothetical protein
MKSFVNNIEDLKANREEIIDQIMVEAETTDMNFVKSVMSQVVSIVTSSNYDSLDMDIYETIERAVADVRGMSNDTTYAKLIDACEAAKMNQRPISMR